MIELFRETLRGARVVWACWCSAPTGLGVACSAPSARSSSQPHWPCLLLAAGFLWQPRLVHTAPQSIPPSLPLSRATHVSFQTLLDTNVKPSGPASSLSASCAMCVTVSERASVRLRRANGAPRRPMTWTPCADNQNVKLSVYFWVRRDPIHDLAEQ